MTARRGTTARPAPAPVTPAYLHERDAAAYAGVSIDTVRRWVKAGLLTRYVLPGRGRGERAMTRLSVVELDAMIRGAAR